MAKAVLNAPVHFTRIAEKVFSESQSLSHSSYDDNNDLTSPTLPLSNGVNYGRLYHLYKAIFECSCEF